LSENIELTEMTAQIVAAYVSNSSVPMADLPNLISHVHRALSGIGKGVPAEPASGPKEPAVPIKKSITPDYLICIEDGKKCQLLKRHLRTKFGLSPDQYRAKWGLPMDYPMVAPNYAAIRSKLAKQLGLGLGNRKADRAPAAPVKSPRGRAKPAT
jgi:predicted transcriptional regulator